MKRLLIMSLGIVGILFFTLQLTSCKKRVITPTHPTPDNNRLLSYTKFITTATGTPVNQNFRFYYDDRGRVTQIAYTSNDVNEINASTAQRLMTFTYVNDTIFKTTTAVQTATVMERDTFILSQKQIVHAYFPDHESHYEYFGKLISKDTRKVLDIAGNISAGTTYTSNNGDLLNRVFDGTLTANFTNDSGMSYFEFPHDTVLSTPFQTVTWTDYGTSSFGAVMTPSVTTTHSMVQTRTDVLTNYTSGGMVSVTAVDPINIVSYSLVWPGGLWGKEGYFVYPDLDNRAGDYMQVASFTLYGVNIYQNSHLIRRIVPQNGPITDIMYTIDADSKITQTYVTHSDLLGKVFLTEVYKIQYETF